MARVSGFHRYATLSVAVELDARTADESATLAAHFGTAKVCQRLHKLSSRSQAEMRCRHCSGLAGRSPASRSAGMHNWRSVKREHPSFSAIETQAALSLEQSGRYSLNSRTPRARSSAGCLGAYFLSGMDSLLQVPGSFCLADCSPESPGQFRKSLVNLAEVLGQLRRLPLRKLQFAGNPRLKTPSLPPNTLSTNCRSKIKSKALTWQARLSLVPSLSKVISSSLPYRQLIIFLFP